MIPRDKLVRNKVLEPRGTIVYQYHLYTTRLRNNRKNYNFDQSRRRRVMKYKVVTPSLVGNSSGFLIACKQKTIGNFDLFCRVVIGKSG